MYVFNKQRYLHAALLFSPFVFRPPLGGDGQGEAVQSEVRTYYMLQTPN